MNSLLSYFGIVQNYLLIRKPEGKPGDGSLLRQKNTKEIIINHKGTRIFKDGEDKYGLRTLTVL